MELPKQQQEELGGGVPITNIVAPTLSTLSTYSREQPS